jgi:MoaA/NifB/PqqE/SkfB family radical SAM enzyme
VNERRWLNIDSARRAYGSASDLAGDWPLEAFFEVSARCNIRCEMCAINYDSRYQARSGRPPFFTPDLFARLRPIFPSLVRAYLFGLGEPTLNPNLVDYVAELSGSGAEVWFNTNATRIDAAMADRLASAGADRITVSIDGASAPTYEKIRRGAKFADVIRGIRALVAAKGRYGRPRVDLSFVAMASNMREMPLLVELCAEIGASGVHVEPLYQQAASADLTEHYQRENLESGGADHASKAFADAAQRAKDLGVFFQSRLGADSREFDYVKRAVKVDWTCSEPWASIWITSAGEVRTCCTNEVAFGNLFERSIERIWRGDDFRRFRSQHAAGETAAGCANCVRNGRVRHSPFFRTLTPVTYEPMFRNLPASSAEDAVVISEPRAHDTVADPLIVFGHINGPNMDYELMIDRTPVARIERKEFTIDVPIAFVTEGAHVVWARRIGDEHGCAYREVFLWRPTPASASPLRPAPQSGRPARPSGP